MAVRDLDVRSTLDSLVGAVSRPALLIALAVFLVAPLTGIGFLTTEIMLFAVAVVGFDVLIGYTGYVSFGQALFFGGGAYTTGFAVEYFGLSFLPAVLVAVVLGVVLAVVIGALSFRRRGVYFALLTLAFAQMFWTMGFIWPEVTGGNGGFILDRPDLNLLVAEVSMSGSVPMFAFTFVVTALALVLAVRIVESPYGQILKAIRENEERATFLGYDTFRYKLVAFAVAGAYAGLAGALYAMYTQFAFLELLFWEQSGELLMMVLIGGLGTIYGPIIGVFAFILLRDYLSAVVTEWPLILGAAFVLIILFSPDGLIGLVRRGRELVAERT
jgi:branched-chain amino acid transport system permease protein